MSDSIFNIVGKPAVGAALESGHRQFQRLLLSETLPRKRAIRFIDRAEQLGIPIEFLSPEALTERTHVENHGGIAAEVGPRRFSPPEAFLIDVAALRHRPLLFALEGFHDPHNLGYALRCLEALGVDGVLLTPREWKDAEGIISQSSSGAYDRLLIAPLQDPLLLFPRLEEEEGIPSISTTAGAQRSFYDFDLRASVLICVGGEFQGLSESTRKACRYSAHLPMNDAIPSFPAGHAAAILAAEASRQRRLGGEPGPLWSPMRKSNGQPHFRPKLI